MLEILCTEELLTSARVLLAEQKTSLAQKPDSVFRRMLVGSAKGQVEELTKRLIAAKEKQADRYLPKEVFQTGSE